MNANEFAYWLQGFSELSEARPTPEQWKSIREHLALVFQKVTPPLRSDINKTPAFTTPGTMTNPDPSYWQAGDLSGMKLVAKC